MTTPSPDPAAMPDSSEGANEPKDSYVKLAMRNMVKKSGKSIFHLSLTTLALMGILIGLAYLTR